MLADAGVIFTHHPIQDQMVIDVGLETDNPDLLVRYGDLVEKALTQSRLFKQVGMKDFQGLIPDLVSHVLDHLPVAVFRQGPPEGDRPPPDAGGRSAIALKRSANPFWGWTASARPT